MKERERRNNRLIISGDYQPVVLLLYLAKQGMALRGDDENLSSSNKGNFSVLKLHLDIKEKQASYKKNTGVAPLQQNTK